MENFYSYKRSTSRGVDSYGYTLITLTNTKTGKKYRTCGGGYDMLGTVAASILNEEYQQQMQDLHLLAEGYSQGDGYKSRRDDNRNSPDYNKHYYGLTAIYNKDGSVKCVHMDGACGFSCVQSLARALGLELSEVYDKSNKRNWRLLGVSLKPSELSDRAIAKVALEEGKTLSAMRSN